MLPTALKVDSIQDLLLHLDVPTRELRDLCLRLEQPSLQEIRDAGADFARGDEEDLGMEELKLEDNVEDILESKRAARRREKREQKEKSKLESNKAPEDRDEMDVQFDKDEQHDSEMLDMFGQSLDTDEESDSEYEEEFFAAVLQRIRNNVKRSSRNPGYWGRRRSDSRKKQRPRLPNPQRDSSTTLRLQGRLSIPGRPRRPNVPMDGPRTASAKPARLQMASWSTKVTLIGNMNRLRTIKTGWQRMRILISQKRIQRYQTRPARHLRFRL